MLNLGAGDKLILKNTHVSDLEAEQFIVSDAATGPTSSASPYVVGVHSSISTQSLLTVGDQTEAADGWQMVGIPDGLGAFDNGDGTFTVLMNHELSPTQGVARDHGATGAFVSTLIIDKTTLEVLSGEDLIKHVFLYDTATNSYFDPVADGNPLTLPYDFDRLCSADLAEVSAFFNRQHRARLQRPHRASAARRTARRSRPAMARPSPTWRTAPRRATATSSPGSARWRSRTRSPTRAPATRPSSP